MNGQLRRHLRDHVRQNRNLSGIPQIIICIPPGANDLGKMSADALQQAPLCYRACWPPLLGAHILRPPQSARSPSWARSGHADRGLKLGQSAHKHAYVHRLARIMHPRADFCARGSDHRLPNSELGRWPRFKDMR